MIVLHGILANMTSLKTLGSQEDILEKRDCYLPDMRNGVYSDMHDQWTYDLYAQDVIGFADKHGIQKFDLLGHSLGGRVAMTIACKFPDRVDGIICLDSPPGKSICENEMYELMRYMTELSEIQKKDGLTKKEAMTMCKEKFADKKDNAAILIKLMKKKSEQIEWLYNTKAFFDKDDDISYFDTSMKSDKQMIYHLIGLESPETTSDKIGTEDFPINTYKETFINQSDDNIHVMKDCGHFI